MQSKSAPPVSVLTAEINCTLSERFLATLSNDPNCRLLPPRLGRAPGLELTEGGRAEYNPHGHRAGCVRLQERTLLLPTEQ